MQHGSEQLLPLTTAQRGLWIGSQIAPPGSTFNIAEAVEILGDIDPHLFVAAITQVSEEAETTRIQIVQTPEGPMQRVVPSVRTEFPFVDVSGELDPDAAALAWMRARILAQLDLERDGLWVSALLKLGPQRFMWLQCCHHIALDGFTGGMLAARLAEVYTAFVEKRAPEPHGFLPIALLVEQEQGYRDSDRRETDRKYWVEQLRDVPDAPTLSMRLDRRNTAASGADGGFIRRSWTIPAEMVERLRVLVRSHGATLPQGLTAMLAAYLFRMTGKEDFVVGMPMTGRGSRTLRQVPGLVANVVALRFRPVRETSFVELLTQSRRVLQSALRHQQFRYEDLRRELGFNEINQHLARFSVNIEPFDYALRFGGATARSHNLSNGAMEDLTVFLFDRQDGEGIRMDFDANPGLYTHEELDAHLARVERLMSAVLADPEVALVAHDLIGGDERQRWAAQVRAAERAWPADDAPALVRRKAADRPDAPAVIDTAGALSYRVLGADVEALRRQLAAAGVGPGHLVAVVLPRDRRLVTALLAIAESGAAWLPLNGHGPVDRLHAILEDARPSLVLCDADMDLPIAVPRLVLARAGAAGVLHGGDADPAPRVPAGTAYVTYTSGTTGRPKGVVVSHANLRNLLLSMREILSVAPDERLLAITTVTFDIAVLELLLPLVAGGTVVVATREEAGDPKRLAEAIARHGVTALQATPTMWQAILGAGQGEALRGLLLLTGGEVLSGQLAERLLGLGRAVFNLYGPTETTIWSTAQQIGTADLVLPAIGRPLANTQLHVVDTYGIQLPNGTIGELAIGGDGVATGYLGQPALTAERFPPDRFTDAAGARLYRTGDRAVRDADGVVRTLGRNDDQVKIKGVRAEPAEIESALLRLSGIEQAAVVLERGDEGAMLVAYLVAGEGHLPAEPAKLRRALSTMLLPQMIPSRFHYLDALPRTPNGKLDRRALPRPGKQDVIESAASAQPRTPTEIMLAQIWRSVLGVEEIGIHDNFFDLGGDSLSAVHLVAALADLGADLSLGHLFTEPTIAGLAPLFDGSAQGSGFLDLVLPLRSEGDAAPLFCLHPVLGVGWSFATLAPHLPQRHPVYALQDIGLLQGEARPASIEALVEIYLEQIRAVQPAGPYHLIGWSMGGLIAHGIASHLRSAGEEVALLALLDSYPFLGTEADPEDMEETVLIRAALDFLKLQPDPGAPMPETTDALVELIAAAIDMGALPATLGQEIGDVPAFIERLRAVTVHNLGLARRYRPGHADTDALFLRAALRGGDGAGAVIHDSPTVWGSHLAGLLTIHEVDCRHQDMMLPAHAARIGGILTRHLDALAQDSALVAVERP
ncbi:non-ribosomal peptide synthetase [Sphingomonas sp. ABOLE]|uniref:non-ribosomal peptide synthetase n=1 Tax=Sphingomonas sp. ABOLE TaxID=1985878 RepID=UPI0013E00E5E|nr:non-ribosomal peptide synthetase [Sphingomonas sp. ABOLE]